jgi:hypothetical protein
MQKIKYILPIIILMTTLISCHYSHPVLPKEAQTEKSADSINHLIHRHYTLNANFEVTSDTLMLQQLPLIDVIPVYKGDKVVVAEFMIQPADSVDSVWVKVARDQDAIGWVRENDLLRKVVPLDSVSQFIHFFSNTHTIIFLVILAFFGVAYSLRAVKKKRIQLAWFNDIESFFPALLSFLITSAATIYVSIQNFVPETWQQFYYNPSLNPFELPFIISLFMINFWMIILVGIATLEDIIHQTRIETIFFYMLGLMSYCILLYLFFSVATYLYIGYICLPIYGWWSYTRLKKSSKFQYTCGNCGAKMKSKGVCSHCGAINE